MTLTERKLLEFQPKDQQIAISVFWRHRSDEVLHFGRLSDVYILAAGYWNEFSIRVWQSFAKKYAEHPLRQFATTLFFLLEEFRLSELIMKKRPGTSRAFSIRQRTYSQYHQANLRSSYTKNFIADALISQYYLAIYEGMVTTKVHWESIQIQRSYLILQQVFEATSTEQCAKITDQLIEALAYQLSEDLIHEYFVIGQTFISQKPFYYHEGMTDAEQGTEEEKETIEEVFRSWHRESEEESGIHLQYELEHGRSSTSSSDEATEGDPSAMIEEVRQGTSSGDESEQWREAEGMKQSRLPKEQKRAESSFGKEHVHVVYEEKIIEPINNKSLDEQLLQWRAEQKRYRRSFVDEIKKRIDLKHEEQREKLSKGRLSANLLTLFVDERPKPFFRKNAPSVQLDAVFGLLVDGSASMLDKLEETKKAVLLFHDVLRELKVHHEISLYYEDAFHASKDQQPNVFELMHRFQDQTKDNGAAILTFDAHEDNRDGFAIRWMTEKLQLRNEKHKFLLVFSDGEPSAFGYDRNGIVDTTEAVLEAEKKGISVIHLFLSTEQPTYEQLSIFQTMFGNKTAASNSVEDFTNQTIRILRKLLAIVIK